MNKKFPFVFALVTLLVLGLGSCGTQRANAGINAEPATRHAAAETTRTYDFGSFDRIELSGVSNIYFTQGPKRSVEGKGTATNLDLVKLYVQDGCLYVKNVGKERNRVSQGCDFYVTAPKLTSLKVSGVGTFEAKTLAAKRFDLRLSGVGKFEVDELKCNDTHIAISGVGDVKTSVEGDNLYVKASGVSNSEIKFKGKVADISNSGVGETTIDLDCDEVKARNSGQSTLKLKGQADKTNIDNSGLATIDTSNLNQY